MSGKSFRASNGMTLERAIHRSVTIAYPGATPFFTRIPLGEVEALREFFKWEEA